MPNPRKHADPEVHMRYRPFLRSRAQAWFLDQEWTMTFEEYLELWTLDKWHCRGRGTTDLVMVRRDTEGPWSFSNCEIVTRREQLQRTARLRGKWSREKNGIQNQINS